MATFRNLGQLAAEAIRFQDNPKLYKGLVEAIDNLRKADLGKLNSLKFFESKQVEAIVDVIKKATNITVTMEEAGWIGPAIWSPRVSNNHIFNQPGIVEYAEYNGESMEADVKTVMKSVNSKVVLGTVDLAKGWIDGIFAKMSFRMLFPQDMLTQSRFTSEEVAAIMAHELGHVFTFCEFANRTLTTNQVISHLTRMLDGSVSEAKRTTVFSAAAEGMKLGKEEADALRQATSSATVALIVLNKHQETAISELGYNAYDVSACEQIADNWAAQQGAGRAMTTGLDKMYAEYGMTEAAQRASDWVDGILIIASGLILASIGLLWVFAMIVFVCLLLVTVVTREQDYDGPESRMRRIRHVSVERLKNKDISPRLREEILADLKVMDETIAKYKDKLGSLENLAYWLRPGYRKDYKFEQLQKSLERLGSNDLFVGAAALKTI